MYICCNESLPILYKLEGSVQKCPDNFTVAVGKYRNAQNETGWGILEVETFPNFPVEMQAYAAGLVEGLLTKVQIYYHYLNTVSQLCKNAKEYCLKLFNYLKLNLEWIESRVMSNPPTDLYWRHVNLTYTQLTGIQDGYGPEKQFYLSRVRFAITPILKIQMAGEFYDLDRVFKKPKTNYSSNSHCSGFIKVLEGNKDILMAHVTMAGLNTMNRILKLYKFAYGSTNFIISN
uniref:Phospholipase B-like n=1 Tax=Meloidogyne enterolobii TaxID=390850 RepID=A0A6V7XP31_MELEN|nr:unnamed protein product [Meloidogyne enterolobii]